MAATRIKTKRTPAQVCAQLYAALYFAEREVERKRVALDKASGKLSLAESREYWRLTREQDDKRGARDDGDEDRHDPHAMNP